MSPILISLQIEKRDSHNTEMAKYQQSEKSFIVNMVLLKKIEASPSHCPGSPEAHLHLTQWSRLKNTQEIHSSFISSCQQATRQINDIDIIIILAILPFPLDS